MKEFSKKKKISKVGALEIFLSAEHQHFGSKFTTFGKLTKFPYICQSKIPKVTRGPLIKQNVTQAKVLQDLDFPRHFAEK